MPRQLRRIRPGLLYQILNRSAVPKELTRPRHSTHRGTPFGSQQWTRAPARSLHLQQTLRSKGRPCKEPINEKQLRPLSLSWHPLLSRYTIPATQL